LHVPACRFWRNHRLNPSCCSSSCSSST
jgi:hypothetical protein